MESFSLSRPEPCCVAPDRSETPRERELRERAEISEARCRVAEAQAELASRQLSQALGAADRAERRLDEVRRAARGP